jgi:hypothetical protein
MYDYSEDYGTASEEDYKPRTNTNAPQVLPSQVVQQQQQQQQQPQAKVGAPLGPDDKEAPTSLKPHKAIFAAVVSFTPRDFFTRDKETGNPVSLKSAGKIHLSSADGTLTRIWCSHAEDFAQADEALMQSIIQSVQTAKSATGSMALGHHFGGKKKKHTGQQQQQQQAITDDYGDIVATVDMKCVTSSWNKALSVDFPAIKKYKNEGFLGANVGVFFIPNKLSSKVGQDFNACTRTITNGNIRFRTRYPRTTLATLDQDVSRHGTTAYISFASPFWGVYNAPKWGNTPITKATHAETNQVAMPLAEAEKWLQIAKTEIAGHMAHGDVTKDFRVTLSVPMPHYRAVDHKLHLEGHKNGVQFQGFADKEYMHQGQTLDTKYFFNAEFHVEYYPSTLGSTI